MPRSAYEALSDGSLSSAGSISHARMPIPSGTARNSLFGLIQKFSPEIVKNVQSQNYLNPLEASKDGGSIQQPFLFFPSSLNTTSQWPSKSFKSAWPDWAEWASSMP